MEKEVMRKYLTGAPWPQVWKTVKSCSSFLGEPAPVFDYNVWALKFLPTCMGLYSSRVVLEKLWNCSESQLVTCKVRLHGGDSKRIWGQISTHRLAQHRHVCLCLWVPSIPASFIQRRLTHDLAEPCLSQLFSVPPGLWYALTVEWCPSHIGLSQTLPTGDISLSPL